MRENTDQNNSEYGHFLRGVIPLNLLVIRSEIRTRSLKEHLREITFCLFHMGCGKIIIMIIIIIIIITIITKPPSVIMKKYFFKNLQNVLADAKVKSFFEFYRNFKGNGLLGDVFQLIFKNIALTLLYGILYGIFTLLYDLMLMILKNLFEKN